MTKMFAGARLEHVTHVIAEQRHEQHTQPSPPFQSPLALSLSRLMVAERGGKNRDDIQVKDRKETQHVHPHRVVLLAAPVIKYQSVLKQGCAGPSTWSRSDRLGRLGLKREVLPHNVLVDSKQSTACMPECRPARGRDTANKSAPPDCLGCNRQSPCRRNCLAAQAVAIFDIGSVVTRLKKLDE